MLLRDLAQSSCPSTAVSGRAERRGSGTLPQRAPESACPWPPSRARTPLRQHFELILQPEMVQRIQHVCFNTFAADLPVVSVLRLAERARTPGHPACCSLAQVGQPIRWGRTWAPACTRTSGHPTLHSPGRTWAPPLMQEFRRRVRQIVGGGVHSEVLQPFPSGLRKRMGEWTRRSGCGDWTVTATFTFAHIDEVLARDRLAIRVACQLRCPGRDEAHKFRGGLLHQKLGFRVDLRARTFGQFLPHYPVDAGQRQQKVLRDTDTGI